MIVSDLLPERTTMTSASHAAAVRTAASRASRLALCAAAPLLAALLPAAHAADAADYPSRPVRIIVGFAPGGSADLTARSVAQELTKRLGQTFVVENRSGASGMIGAEAVARAPADGYTLYEATMTTHGIGPNLYKKIPYDPVESFEPVALMVQIPLVLFAHTSVGAGNVKELVALLKANPQKYRYSSAGNGSPPHLAAELFKLKAGVDILHVPFKGAAPALIDVAGGHTQVAFGSTSSTLPHLRTGKLRALGLGGRV
ncbi:MAG TPA: tripartite tricarboxylate transporter substrate-binding protein, partial [Sandaracinaceae bacterium]